MVNLTVNLITTILFFSGITVVFALSLFGKTRLGLLFLIPLFPLQNVIERFHQFPFGKDFIDILLIAMLIGWALRAMRNKDNLLEKTQFNKLLFLMAFFTFISFLRGSFYLGSSPLISLSDPRLQSWKNYMLFPLIYFLIVNNIKKLKYLKIMILLMVFSIFIMDYYTINQIRWMSGLLSRAKIHGTFVFLGPNEMAAFYATYTFVLLGILLFDKTKIRKTMFFLAVSLNIYCLLFLFSRGAYIAFFAGLLILSFVKMRKLIIPLILVLFFWQAILPTTVIERVQQTKTEEGTLDVSSEKRLEMWQYGVNLFKENPIVGVGFNVFPYLGYSLSDTHNIYIKTMAEEGAIGLIILLLLFYMSFRSGWQLYKDSNDGFLKGLGLGFISCVFATFAGNFFGNRWTHFQLGAYYWVFLALVVRGNKISQTQAKVVAGKNKNKNANSPAYK